MRPIGRRRFRIILHLRFEWDERDLGKCIPRHSRGVQVVEAEHQLHSVWKKLGVIVMVECSIEFDGQKIRELFQCCSGYTRIFEPFAL